MSKMSRILALLLAICMLASLCACGSSASTTAAAEESADAEPAAESAAEPAAESAEEALAVEESAEDAGDEASGPPELVRIGMAIDLGVFKPINGGMPSDAASLVFDTLFWYDQDAGELCSDVLDDFYWEDENTYIMKLKDGIYFSDGNPMTSEDVLFSLQYFNEHCAQAAENLLFIDLENSYCEDDSTVVLKTFSYYAPFLYDMFNLCVYEKAWAEEVGYDSDEWYYPVGSGPYECVAFQENTIIDMVLRDDYWGDSSKMPKEIKFIYYAEPTTMFIDLETGGLDLGLKISTEDYERGLDGSIEGVKVQAIDQGSNTVFSMDSANNEYLANEKVREAIAYGVDWKVVADSAFGDLWQEPSSILPSQNPFYEYIGTYEYDPERAAQALADSGFDPSEINIHIVCINDAPRVACCEVIQYYLSELGITMTMEVAEIVACLEAWYTVGGTDLNIDGAEKSRALGDPQHLLSSYFPSYSGQIPSIIPDDTVDELAVRAATEKMSDEERQELYTEIAQIVYDHYYQIPICETYAPVAYRTDIIDHVNFTHNSTTSLRLIKYVGVD